MPLITVRLTIRKTKNVTLTDNYNSDGVFA